MNRTVKQAKQDVKKAYAKRLREMQSKVDQLDAAVRNWIGDGQVPDRIDWSDVGDLGHINDSLDQVLNFIHSQK